MSHPSSSKKTTCSLCPHHCRLKINEHGLCKGRINTHGKIVPLFYGDLCAVNIDPIEKKPFYHFLPGERVFSIASAGCNLHCTFCQNWTISQHTPDKKQMLHFMPEHTVQEAIAHTCLIIAYTYTEPLVSYEYTYDTALIARQQGLLNLIITAGYIEQTPLKKLCKIIDAANVDLKGITDIFYRTMTGATLKPVLDSIVTMKKEGLWLEITNLLIPTKNDKDEDIRALARWVRNYCGADTPLHFSRFWPMHQQNKLHSTPLQTLTRACEIARQEGLRFIYTGNVPTNEASNTFCPSCHKTMIERNGYQILQNHLLQNKCPNCNTAIAGIWDHH